MVTLGRGPVRFARHCTNVPHVNELFIVPPRSYGSSLERQAYSIGVSLVLVTVESVITRPTVRGIDVV